jgi:hypothetical protein
MSTVLDPLASTEPDWMPEVYVYVDESGKTTVVDGDGQPVPSPPHVTLEPISVIVPGYTHEQLAAMWPDTVLVDGELFRLRDPWGRLLWEYQPPTTGVYVHEDPATGAVQVVDGDGNPLPSPPLVEREPDALGFTAMAADGSKVPLPTYQPPTTGVYVYVDPATGEYQVVDGDGNPLPSPPLVEREPDALGFTAMAADGSKVPLPTYAPPTTGVYVHVDPATGEYQVVDGDGNPLPSPPLVEREPDALGFTAMAADGSKVPLPTYAPPTTGVYVYEDPATGEYQVVDGDGNPLPSPPLVEREPDALGFTAMAADGSKVPLPTYAPPTTGVYVYEDPATGEYQVVDGDGNPLPSPPFVLRDLDGHSFTAMAADGSKVPLPTYWPPAGEPPAEWPPSELEGDEGSVGEGVADDEEGTVPAEAEAAPSSEATAGPASLGEPTAEGIAEEDAGASTGDRLGFSEAEDVLRRFGGVEMEQGPVVADDDLNEEPRLSATAEVSVTGLAAGELSEMVWSVGRPPGEVAEAVRMATPVGEVDLSTVADMSPPAPGETVSVIPINLPMPPPEPVEPADVDAPSGPAMSGETVSATPITLPMPPPPAVEEVEVDAMAGLAATTPGDRHLHGAG